MIRSFPRCMALLGILLQCGGTLQAHDLWLQTNTTVVRTGDVVHIDCMLGNHGNDHRDFKLAGKPGIETIKNLEVILPDGVKNAGQSWGIEKLLVKSRKTIWN